MSEDNVVELYYLFTFVTIAFATEQDKSSVMSPLKKTDGEHFYVATLRKGTFSEVLSNKII